MAEYFFIPQNTLNATAISDIDFVLILSSPHQLLSLFPRQNRSKLVLATKFGRMSDPTCPNGEGASRGHMMAAIDASLKRLETDYVDLLYVSILIAIL